MTISATARAVTIPRSFLGFSSEYWGVPVDARHLLLFRRLVSLLHPPGDGRFVLRIGGNSADHALWDPDAGHAPSWVYPVGRKWLHQTASVVRAADLRLIVDLDLVTGDPARAAQWARQVMLRMPHHSVAGFEIGNEPDIYDRRFWLAHLGTEIAGRVPAAITSASYDDAYAAYARALRPVAAHVPLLGPALAEPSLDRAWISRLIGTSHPRLGAISVHDYPYTACASPRGPEYPTIARLLSPNAGRRVARSLPAAVRIARAGGLPVRVTEFNSVTCGGLPGVSNTFATALWAPEALFSLLRVGVRAADLHVRAFSINSPFRFHHGSVDVRPLFYGLCLFSRMLAPGARLLTARVTPRRGSPAALRLTAWAVRDSAGTLRVLLLNTSRRPIQTRLALPAGQPVSVQRLLAPGPRATGDITLAGQQLNRAAEWTGRRRIADVRHGPGGYPITLPRDSAALVTART